MIPLQVPAFKMVRIFGVFGLIISVTSHQSGFLFAHYITSSVTCCSYSQ